MAAIPVGLTNVFARTAHRTGLLGDTFHKKRSPDALVAAMGGIRGDKLDSAHLALAARLPNYEPEYLFKHLQDRKTLIRTWGVRGVLQVIPRTQTSMYLAGAGITAPRWMRFLDARSNLSTTARLRLLKRLCPETLSRDMLREAIADSNTRLFMLREAAQEGYIVWKDGEGPQSTFIWTKDWLGKKLERIHDYTDLVGSYLDSYGPIGAADLAGWLGVTVAAARKLIAKHRVTEIGVEGEDASTFIKDEHVDELRGVRKNTMRGLVVIPPGDPFLLAFKTRFHPDPDSGSTTGLVFHDSRLAGSWTLGKEGVALTTLDAASVSEKTITKAIHELMARAGLGEVAVSTSA